MIRTKLLQVVFALVFTFPINLMASGPASSNSQLNINHNLRSDTMDVLHYHVNLQITSVTSSPISGYTDVKVVPKMNGIANLSLDLLKLTIDSVILNNNQLTYTYNDTLLNINLGSAYNIGDTITVQVAYHGIPQTDPSGFGGFSFSSGYAYNLGVGFAADPHVYGRVWHPCFDNFVERATYSFEITTSNTHKAVCNGLMTSSINNPNNTITWNWNFEQAIPSYLACVAVAAYTTVHKTFSSLSGPMPVELVAVPSDTTNMKNSFIKLENAFDAFEDRFGPYRWSKVGYVLVPFNGGAMEHATNIAYPKVAVTSGTTQFEAELMSHELAHHWFGDLVTCETAEDMWLNEGWASFGAFIFTESVYGYEAYKNAIRTNQAKILQFAHIKEGGYRAVSGVPHEWTYGDHVYLKGASMAHTIRGYMGDSLFFDAVKYYLNNNQFTDVTSNIMRADFETSSGVNLTDCFNDWVFNPGYAHFSIDSFSVVNVGGVNTATVYVRQKLTGAPSLYTNVPLEVTFKNNAFNSFTSTIMMSGQTGSFTINVPFMPTYAGINLEGKIADATVSQYKTIKTTGNFNMPDLKLNLTVTAITDSAFIRIEHNFAAPDAMPVGSGITISPNRYFKIDGIFTPGFDATANIIYDGRSVTASGNQFLDNMLFTATLNEDSLVMLYRSNPSQAWTIYPYYTKVMSNVTDKFGTIKLDSILKGEYVLGMASLPTALENKVAVSQIKLIPNPAKDIVNIDLSKYSKSGNIIELSIYNAEGKWIRNHKIEPQANQYEMNINGLSNGIYYFIFTDGVSYATSKLVIHN